MVIECHMHRKVHGSDKGHSVCRNVESIHPQAVGAAHILLLTLLSYASEHQVYPSVHLSPENKLSLSPSANV